MKAWGLGSFFSSLAVPIGLQKRLVSFLLQRAIGHFLEDDLDLEKLDIELSNGTVHLTDLKLNTRALNDFAAGTPLAVTQGRIGSITATIPWRNLWNGQCVLEIDGIDVTLAPVQTPSAAQHDHEDQLLSSSVELANDFLQHSSGKEEAALQESLLQTFQSHATQAPTGMPGDFNSRPASKPSQPNQSSSSPTSVPMKASDDDSVHQASDGEGIQFVARLIEKLMARIQIICKGTTIRFRHSSNLHLVNSQSVEASGDKLDYELEIRLPYIAYRDETPGWDQSAGAMDASSLRSSSSAQGSESASASTVLEESVMPSVIWQDSPESIKVVVFKGFSVWIRQKGGTEKMVSELDPSPTMNDTPETVVNEPLDEQDGSDSDTDIFSDAQENFSASMMASQIASRRLASLPPPLQRTPIVTQRTPHGLYEAEILSTLQHKNRIKVNIRKNATMVAGSTLSHAQTTVKSLLDVDFHIRSIFVALSPGQLAFILELLELMGSATHVDTVENDKTQTRPEDEHDNENMALDVGNGFTFGSGSVLREGPGYHESLQRTDTFADRTPHVHRESPLSPRRSQPINPLRMSSSKSLGGRPLDLDRHAEARNPRVTTPNPAIFLDSSKFISGSAYTEGRPRSSMPSPSSASGVTPSLSVKLKGRISTLQLFVLYQDPQSLQHIPTEASFFKHPTPEALRASHLKLELDSMILRYQQWTSAWAGANEQKSAKSSKGQIDFTLSNLTVAEWIESAPRPFDTASWTMASDQYRVPPRRQYIPLVEFDTDQDLLLQTSPTSKFPVLQVPDRYLSERSLLLRSKKNKRQPDSTKPSILSTPDPSVLGKDSLGAMVKEVVRMRVVLGSKKDGAKPNAPSSDAASSAGYARDITIEVKPMQLHADFYTFQRLERCLVALVSPGEKESSSAADHHQEQKSHPQRPLEQQMVDDLEGATKNSQTKSRIRLRLNSVQLWVSVPDMALTLAGKEDTGPEYRSAYDVLSVNISKLVLMQASEVTKGVSAAPEGVESSTGRSAEDHTPKIKIDFASASVFMIPAHETTSRAILYIGSLTTHPASLSGFSQASLPSLEITARLPGSLPTYYEQTSSSEILRIPAIQAFAILEGEENVHNTTEEEEELMHFKQRTIETSLLVINTHFPLVAVHLEKRVLDNFQLRANDLGTWLAIFSEQLAVQMPTPQASPVADFALQEKPLLQSRESSDTRDDPRSSLDETSRDDQRASLDGGFRDDQSELGTDQSTAYGEELRQQAAGNPSAPRSRLAREHQNQLRRVKPTMASIIISAQTVEVILDYPTAPSVLDPVPTIKSYQINVSDANIFTAAKFQSGSDTYLSVDAEELEFWEISAQKPKALLLTRTIPKTVKIKSPKPMFHMTSFLSFDPVRKHKENDINLAFTGISWKFSIEQTAVDDVQDFFAEPVGILYYNPPSQCTRVGVDLSECCMDYKPLNIPPRFVLSFEKMKVFSTLIPEAPTLRSKVQIYNMALFLIDHTQSTLYPQHPTVGSPGPGIESRQFWRSLGFAMIGQCPFFELNSTKSKTGQLPLYDLMITNHMFYLETCSDSFETLMQLGAYLGDNGDMPIEKKRTLERLAEAERAANRAKSNVIYQDVLASLDEDAFRKPSLDRELENTGTLDFTEGFYSVERDESENDHFKAQMRDTPNIDGFHEVYADLLVGSQATNAGGVGEPANARHGGKQTGKAKGSKSKSRVHAPPVANPDQEPESQLQALGMSTQAKSSSRTSLDSVRRDGLDRPAAHSRKDSQPDDIVRVLDSESEFNIIENHFSIPVLTEEERAKDDGSLAKLRLRVRDFDFSWRLYDGLDWEMSRLDEEERKKQARQLANRLYDPNDVIHTTMDSAQSNMEASIFERLSGVQANATDRQGGPSRKELSPPSSEADSTSDYQNDLMSQASGTGRPSSSSSASGSRRFAHQQHQNQHSTSHSHQDSTHKRKKRLERSKTAMIEFNADKVRLDFEDYVAGIETASHLSVRVRQFEIIDNLKTSLWHKFLSLQRPDSHTATPRLTQSNMIRIDLDGVRPVVSASTVEHRLRIKILPLRLYIDQDALIFLIKFFVQSNSGPVANSADDMQPEGMAAVPDSIEKKRPNEMYFQSVKMGEISVKMDYKPKHVDYTGLTGGNFVELMNFFHLDAAEMTLQEVRLHGINGFAKLGQDLVAAWLPHIRSTQVPHMVSGLTPIRSLVNLGSGIADLVLLPIEQYKRDGHIIRGLQKGGQAFTRATTLEALKIGTRLAVGTQVLLEHADEIFGSANASGTSGSGAAVYRENHVPGEDGEDPGDIFGGKRVVATMVSDTEAYMQESIGDEDQLLQQFQQQQQRYQQEYQQQQQQQLTGQGSSSSSSGGASSSSAHRASNKISKYANQPADINEGMELAYKSLSKNIGTAAHTIFAVPMEVYERTGAQGSVRAVIRAVPVAVLKPMIGATEAFSKVLIGLRNSIDPAQRLQMEDKYKRQ